MSIIGFLSVQTNHHVKDVYVLTVGALGNDISVYWKIEYVDKAIDENMLYDISLNGRKINISEFKSIQDLIMTRDVLKNLPEDWYYRS